MKWAPRSIRLLTALAVLAAGGCASLRGRAKSESPEQAIQMDPVVITGDVQLQKLNAEELFASAESAFAAQDFKQAARYFDRLADFHPESRHFRAATYNAGLAHEKNEEWEAALSRFTQLADARKGTGDALDAAFRLAEVLYHLARYADAVQVLNELGARADLTPADRLQAKVQRGVCEVEGGRLDVAEATFRGALAEYQSMGDKSVLDDFYPSQAQFFLGEIYRLRYQSISLDAEKAVDQLSNDLEYKAELLLSAQGHYLRAIRMGNGFWATASGERIGGLYEDLYQQMVNSPAPKELNSEEADVYRQELRKKVRILITKAINIYERTLETAERIGAANPFVERTRESLRKMKELLLADAQKDDEAPSTN
jgi:tetratricopeptide (TPR) repeat protein